MRSLLPVLLVIALGSPAMATDVQPSADQPAPAAAKGEQVKCKRLDDDNTGSNMKRWKKVCKTVSEWRAQEAELERRLNDGKASGTTVR